jgi:hypothetical protein
LAFLDEEGEEERRRRKDRIWGFGEGGCCLLELFAVATCFAALMLVPLLVR